RPRPSRPQGSRTRRAVGPSTSGAPIARVKRALLDRPSFGWMSYLARDERRKRTANWVEGTARGHTPEVGRWECGYPEDPPRPMVDLGDELNGRGREVLAAFSVGGAAPAERRRAPQAPRRLRRHERSNRGAILGEALVNGAHQDP